MQLHDLTPKTARTRKQRVGRGGARGKTAGRGTKGQNARAGTSKRPEERDLIKKLPKLRGHGINRGRTVNTEREKPQGVTLAALEQTFSAGATVTPRTLTEQGLVRRFRGRTPQVKLLATGTLTKALTVEGCAATAGARSQIEAAGGSVA
ncbi:50S ribosomal protein L15 [Patescibacteria group bacterium]|jgi:large subunit ribosomal protein L15|nr:50S ribosomal protein L15 [Patescibacteria group bacterium]